MSNPARLLPSIIRPAFDDRVNGCQHDKKGDHGRGGVRLAIGYGNEDCVVELSWLVPVYLPETVTAVGAERLFGGDDPSWRIFAADLNYHETTRRYEEQHKTLDCLYVQPCFTGGSGLEGTRVAEILVRQGSDALTAELARLWHANARRASPV